MGKVSEYIELADEFERIARMNIDRPGIEDLLNHLVADTDFYFAPCSTRYHLSEYGGLVKHSLHVAEIFNHLCDTFAPSVSYETRYLLSLFHDVCKVNTYKACTRSRRTGRTLPNGRPEWEDYDSFDYESQFPYGHGEKSVYIISKFIKLTDEEAIAIRWHMGFSDSSFKGGALDVSNAMTKYPVTALLHAADLIATSQEE